MTLVISEKGSENGHSGSSLERFATIKRLEMVVRAQERRAGPDTTWGGAPGFAVAVSQGDDVLLRTGVGLASIEHRLPIGPGTAFRIASLSKQFTAAAVLLLAREGLLDLDSDIRDVLRGRLPWLNTAAPRGMLSLRRLLHMTSGLRDFLTMFRAGGLELGQRIGVADIQGMVDRHTGLNFPPNTRNIYSNTNYLLLGEAAAQVAGQSLAELLRLRLFEPLGMTSTRHAPEPDAIEPGLATPYIQLPDENGVMDPRNGKWLRATQRFPIGGEGGVVSTLDDMLVWAQALRAPPRGFEFLPAALRERLPFSHGVENAYARGQEVRLYRGLTTVSHGGLWPGFRSEFLLLPQRRIAIIVISNDSGLNPQLLGKRLLDALLWNELGSPELPDVAPPPPGLYLDAASGLTVRIGGPDRLLGGAPTLSLYSTVMPLRPEKDGWWTVEASGQSMQVKSGQIKSGQGHVRAGAAGKAGKAREDASEPADETLAVIDDAGRRSTLKRIERAAELPFGISGRWRCEELDCIWTISLPEGGKASIEVEGPVAARARGWLARPLAGDWFEIQAAGKFLPASFVARLQSGALIVHTARARNLRFERDGRRAPAL